MKIKYVFLQLHLSIKYLIFVIIFQTFKFFRHVEKWIHINVMFVVKRAALVKESWRQQEDEQGPLAASPWRRPSEPRLFTNRLTEVKVSKKSGEIFCQDVYQVMKVPYNFGKVIEPVTFLKNLTFDWTNWPRLICHKWFVLSLSLMDDFEEASAEEVIQVSMSTILMATFW